MSQRDLVILGAGPAGLTAGLYGARAKLDTLILENMITGGQIVNSLQVENFPGFAQISGQELTQKMEEQARQFGAEFWPAKAMALEPDGKGFRIQSDQGEVQARSVIIATGAQPKELDVPGERELTGRGVSYCATCDAPFYQGQTVVVVGGGNAAAEEAQVLSRFADQVLLFHRREKLRATGVLQERLFANPKVDIYWNTVVDEIVGKEAVESVRARNVKENQVENIACSGVFIYAGYIPNTSFLQGVLDLDDRGYIITGAGLATSLPGVFAAGDVRQKTLRQVVTAAADGAEAAFSAERHLEEQG